MFKLLAPRIILALAGAAGFLLSAQQGQSQSFSPEAIEFFEGQVRPVLQENCLACHSAQLRTSGLSLESREAVVSGGNRGPAAAPGQPDQSVLIEAVRYVGDLKMPPAGKLSDHGLAVLTQWVEMGLPWSGPQASAAERPRSEHWAFQPIRRQPPPAVTQTGWARNSIDRFIQARLEKEGFEPSPTADRATLIRRLSLDLLGLPPSPAEVEAFTSDDRPDAYERLVDRLLDSPHYGERWGRHWLDLARYADSNGYNIDGPREIWMYRDWVINALNRDLPFDQFVVEQIAGDLLPNATKEQIVATGFHRNTLLNLEGGIDFEQYRVEAVVDRVDNTGAVFLGLTLGCARCHDHKFDPISQREFYQLYAFYNNVDELGAELQLGEGGEIGRARAHEPILEFGTPDELTRREAIRAQIKLLEEELKEYEKPLLARQAEWERTLSDEERGKLKPEVQDILKVPAAEREDMQTRALENAFKATDLGYTERQAGIQALRDLEPKVPNTLVMRELPEPRQAFIHLGGDFLRKGIEVSPGVPAVLPPLDTSERATRLELARWLVDPENPLTPRVTVNRIWQRYFGKGLVETENDFGSQGSPPSHPELLDWLAAEFIDLGWSQKAVHRLIVTSATYRQSSKHRPELAKVDPQNRLLGRQERLRLEAEIVRDAALRASGLLTEKIGGPSVFPPQPAGSGRVTQIDRQWVADRGPDRYRRGMYTYFWRSSPHPGLMVFDAPDSTTTCTRRNRSNTPLQALTLLNDEAYTEFARNLAGRVLNETSGDNAERLERAFRICLARAPKPHEQARLETFLAGQLDDFRTNPDQAWAIVPGDVATEGADVPLLAAWSAVSRVLLNLDEFVTRE